MDALEMSDADFTSLVESYLSEPYRGRMTAAQCVFSQLHLANVSGNLRAVQHEEKALMPIIACLTSTVQEAEQSSMRNLQQHVKRLARLLAGRIDAALASYEEVFTFRVTGWRGSRLLEVTRDAVLGVYAVRLRAQVHVCGRQRGATQDKHFAP